MTNDPKSLDILGIKPIADSIKKVTDATVDGVSAFLSRICLPAAKEFGLLLRDRVRGWRAANIAAVVSVAEKRHDAAHAGAEVHAHPRIVRHIVEEASWMDDPVVQDLWGGLLASSCTETGDDESNLIYINLLSGLTKLQARLLKYLCESTPKRAAENGLIFPVHQSTLTLDTITEITGEPDIHRLDSEIDN